MPILLKLHIKASLVESSTTTYRSSKCGEEKFVVPTFLGGRSPGCPDCLRVGINESHNFVVLHCILGKMHIRTWLIESFRTTYSSWRYAEEKFPFTPVHTLRQLQRDKGLFPPPRGIAEFRARYGSEVRLKNCTQVFWEGTIWRVCNSQSRKIVLHTCSGLTKPVQTSSQNNDRVRSSRSCNFCATEGFLLFSLMSCPAGIAFLARLFDSYPMVYGWCSCIEI